MIGKRILKINMACPIIFKRNVRTLSRNYKIRESFDAYSSDGKKNNKNETNEKKISKENKDSLLNLMPKVFESSQNISSVKDDMSLPINAEANYYSPLKRKLDSTEERIEVAKLELRSYGKEHVNFFADFAARAAYYLKMPISGPAPLRTKRELFTVIRAPFVHAKSKENFERVTSRRIIRVFNTNPEVVDTWLWFLKKHELAGVGMKATVYKFESIDTILSKSHKSLESKNKKQNQQIVKEKANEILATPEFKKLLESTPKDESKQTKKAEPVAEKPLSKAGLKTVSKTQKKIPSKTQKSTQKPKST